MLLYTDLSGSQRRWVDLVEFCFPDISETITYQKIKDIHNFFTEKRKDNPKYKISKALWLITNNAMTRGVYKFPSSKLADEDAPMVEDTEMEKLYKAELAKYGIPIKKSK
jgi:hypothetical protein